MGDVKEAVKGSPSKKKSSTSSDVDKNLLSRLQDMSEEISELVVKKDEDVLNEGDAAKPENMRKSATLRAAFSLVRTAKQLLEDY